MKGTLLKIWDHFEEFFLIPSLMFSVALVFIQVIMRYVFKNSLTWSEELARYLYIWQTWIGISYAARNGSHLRITMIRDRLPEKGKQILELIVTLIWIAFGIFVIVMGAQAVSTIASYGQKSAALQIPMQICYIAIPVGMFLMCVRLVERTVKDFLANRRKTAEGGKAE